MAQALELMHIQSCGAGHMDIAVKREKRVERVREEPGGGT